LRKYLIFPNLKSPASTICKGSIIAFHAAALQQHCCNCHGLRRYVIDIGLVLIHRKFKIDIIAIQQAFS